MAIPSPVPWHLVGNRVFGADKGLENVLEEFRRHTVAGVGDRNEEFGFVGIVTGKLGQIEENLSAFRSILHGV